VITWPWLDAPMRDGLVRVLRGEVVESVHRASAAVVDAEGRLVASFGNPDLVTFARSTLKPVQALPFVESGAADSFGFGSEELAMAASSHNGEAQHVELVHRMLQRIGLGVDALQCGAHPPYHAESARALGNAYTALHNNCSGKHAGMLAVCVHEGWDVDTYLDPDHPLQRRILGNVSQETGLIESRLASAMDGCSAPNYALPLRELARSFARLMSAERLGGQRAASLSRIRDAMTAHPFLVGGTGRTDTRFMQAFPGRVWAKAGGEACYGIGLLVTGLGVALKIEDGATRAVPPLLHAILREFGVADEAGAAALRDLVEGPLWNVAGHPVGRLETEVRLARAAHPSTVKSAGASPR
jgi:L-asparaginase II